MTSTGRRNLRWILQQIQQAILAKHLGREISPVERGPHGVQRVRHYLADRQEVLMELAQRLVVVDKKLSKTGKGSLSSL
jgi:hypothetical protein